MSDSLGSATGPSVVLLQLQCAMQSKMQAFMGATLKTIWDLRTTVCFHSNLESRDQQMLRIQFEWRI